jgi:hypothetical protein
MISHVVLIRLRSGLGAEREESFLAQARAVLGPIPGVLNLRVGRNLRPASTHPLALVMEFADEAALQAYQVHPEHQRFLAEIIGPIIEDKQVLDYLAPGSGSAD